MVYEGDNDNRGGASRLSCSATTFWPCRKGARRAARGALLRAFRQTQHQALGLWPQMREANRLLAELCAGDARIPSSTSHADARR
jgi:hypothetical protein